MANKWHNAGDADPTATAIATTVDNVALNVETANAKTADGGSWRARLAKQFRSDATSNNKTDADEELRSTSRSRSSSPLKVNIILGKERIWGDGMRWEVYCYLLETSQHLQPPPALKINIIKYFCLQCTSSHPHLFLMDFFRSSVVGCF